MTVRGWCPSLSLPMPTIDGLLLRLRPRFGRLRAEDARLIAAAARRYGNGLIEVTNRGNLQLRGFSPDSARHAAAMTGHLDQPAHRPTLLANPLLGIDPAMAPDSETIAASIADLLDAMPALTGPAEKFFVALDGGGLAGLGPTRADITINATPAGWALRRDGEAMAILCAGSDVAGIIATWLAEYRAAGVARMRDLFPAAAPGASPDAAAPCLGFLPSVGAFGLGLVFGTIESDGFARIAAFADRYGDGGLRLTPWRSILLTGVEPAAAVALEAAAAGLIITPDDPRSTINACVGAAFCAAASTATRDDALALAALWPGLHVSGCIKGCAHPLPASLTLVGHDGLYDIVHPGRAGDAPVRARQSLEAVAAYLRHASAMMTGAAS
ncbi:precorrin-3B synthase [Acidiphilium sp.]|uniref:precorrin-3B synthase n=1 Tax=Acidiphilium sp. TaxID=527 RepID=UPI003D06A889